MIFCSVHFTIGVTIIVYEEGVRLSKMGTDFLIETTLIDEEKLKDYKSRKADWYISAEEAVKMKIADEYYK